MAGDVIKMNGAGFNTRFVLSLSLQEFVDYGVAHGIYYQEPQKQVAMLVQVWNIAHGKQTTYTVNEPKLANKAMMPKAVKIVKK